MSDRLKDNDDNAGRAHEVEESALTQSEVLAAAVRVAASRCTQDLSPAPMYRMSVDG